MTNTRRDFLIMASAGAVMGPTLPAFAARRDVLYDNTFDSPADLEGWRVEGSAHISLENGRMIMENARPPEDGQASNFVHWCLEEFPTDIEATWTFRPLREPGLSILFFGTKGLIDGKRVSPFDKRLAERQGLYDQYNNSDLEYLSVSYFRRRWASERGLHVVNLRYAPGFQMLATGPDPIPCVNEGNPEHRIKLRRQGRQVIFYVDDLKLIDWTAPDGQPMPEGGYIGFRQMAPLKASYGDFVVRAI